MVTGRVCKNILGLFSNGIKETLEVKLKLIPVPACMQKEYVENMERYHSLSRMMPQGFDYSNWSDFLDANPAIAQLAQPTPQLGMSNSSLSSFSQMIAHPVPMNAPSPACQEQSAMQYRDYSTRPSSPAMSMNSYAPSPAPCSFTQNSRPASRASFRGESQRQDQEFQAAGTSQDQQEQEEGPAKKRARTTKTTRPKKAVLGVNNDSLRVTASTAASVRLHRPVPSNPGMDMALADQGPRAPTPRPGDKYLPHARGQARSRGTSSLRHASMDEGRSHAPLFDSGIFSDNAIDSADDDRGISPGETPMDFPSSPPLMPQRMASPVPSSPGLPSLPLVADSGFASDLLQRRDDEIENPVKPWDGSDLPVPPTNTRIRRKQDRSHHPWTRVDPGPVELLPKNYVAKPKTYPRPRTSTAVEKIERAADEVQQLDHQKALDSTRKATDQSYIGHFDHDVAYGGQEERRMSSNTALPSVEMQLLDHLSQTSQTIEQQPPPRLSNTPAATLKESPMPADEGAMPQESRSTTPKVQPKRSKSTKAKGLPRSNTWSGEPMSDSIGPGDFPGGLPRSGSGARRRQNIVDKLQQSIDAKKMPDFCNHCGEIETPTWRKAYTRIEDGTVKELTISSKGPGIVAAEMVSPPDCEPRRRIFKQFLEAGETAKDYEVLTLCNCEYLVHYNSELSLIEAQHVDFG